MYYGRESRWYLILSHNRLSETLRLLTLLDFHIRSIWVGLSLHICLKLNTALFLFHASWLFGMRLLIHYEHLSLGWLLPPHRLQTTLRQRPAFRQTTDLRQGRQIGLIARPMHPSFIRLISGYWKQTALWWVATMKKNWFRPYVFCRIIPFICCWSLKLLFLSRANENRAVFYCLHYD